MIENLQPLIDWIAQHPTWAGIIIFLISVSESLAVVGLFVPGVAMMFGIGALVGAGAYPLLPCIAWAVAGAVVGDGISFWLGYHYKEHLREMWPLRRYPAFLARGEDFFIRHGGKSVLIGRFVGPVRPIIPVVAGMLGMPIPRFYLINVVSALLWAPAYLLPGVLFGASLGLASEVGTRLMVLVVALLLVMWLVIWLSRRFYLTLSAQANRLIDRLLQWGYHHPRLRGLTAAIVEPGHPEARGLFASSVLLLVLVWAFVSLVMLVIGKAPTPLDNRLWHIMTGLRTPWADQFMVMVSLLGGVFVTSCVGIGVALWLAWTRCWFVLLHWCAALVFGAWAPILLKVTLQLPRPLPVYDGLMSFGLPSWHVTMNTVLYGFLAVIITRELPLARRWIAYAVVAVLVMLIAISRLYLGVHWFTDVVGGLIFGLLWVVLIGIAYRRHVARPLDVRPVLLVTVVMLAGSGGWLIDRNLDQEVRRHALPQEMIYSDSQSWARQGWQELPVYRLDLEGNVRQPLTVQWLADGQSIRARLLARGWRAPEPFNMKSAMHWLISRPAIGELPVLPQVHDGQHDEIRLIHALDSEQRQLVLRLWRSDVMMTDRALPLWIGYVSSLQLVQPAPFIS
ncbi:MAG: hypothetical protein A2V90_09380, partial [Gammaproteobacteria bacterium RBG_16_57_12]